MRSGRRKRGIVRVCYDDSGIVVLSQRAMKLAHFSTSAYMALLRAWRATPAILEAAAKACEARSCAPSMRGFDQSISREGLYGAFST